MKILKTLCRAGIAATSLACVMPVVAANFSFSQAFSDGSALSGSFSGTDDGDSFLDKSELAWFSLTFTSLASSGTFSLGDLSGFGYCLTAANACASSNGPGVLGDDDNEGLLIDLTLPADSQPYLAAGRGVVGADESIIDFLDGYSGGSSSPIVVTQVAVIPEPSVGWLLGAGLLALGASRRFQRRART